MRHSAAALAGIALAALLLSGCERSQPPTAGTEDVGVRSSAVPDHAALQARINGRINDLFPPGQKSAPHELFDRIKDAVEEGDLLEARGLVSDLLQLAASTDLADPRGPETTAEAYSDFIDLVLQFVGIDDVPQIDPELLAQVQDGDDGTVALALGDRDNTITTESEFAGTFIPDAALPDDEDVVIVIERLTESERDGPCLPTDLEQREGCYQFDRFPEGDFLTEVEVGVCAPEDIPDFFQLHKFESVADGGEGVVVALPNIQLSFTLGCDSEDFLVESSPSLLPLRLVESAWTATGGRLLEWIGPQRLEAINIGFGGATTNFSRIGWAKAMDVDIVDGDLQSAQPGSRVPIDPQVRVTHLPDGDDSHVLQGAEVTFTVVGGGGTLTAAEVATVTDTSDSGGLVSVPWRLGADGANQLRAAVPGDTVMFTATTAGNLLASCTPDPGGDQLSRGYYYPDYPASSLDRVDMFFSAETAGSYEIVLTAREGTYGGAIIGDDTVTVSLSSDSNDNQRTTFLFGGASVAADTVAFEMEMLSGPGTPFFAVSTDETCPMVETEDTSPPLSTERFGGRGVGADVYGSVN